MSVLLIMVDALTRVIILMELTYAAVLIDSIWTKIDAPAKVNVI